MYSLNHDTSRSRQLLVSCSTRHCQYARLLARAREKADAVPIILNSMFWDLFTVSVTSHTSSIQAQLQSHMGTITHSFAAGKLRHGSPGSSVLYAMLPVTAFQNIKPRVCFAYEKAQGQRNQCNKLTSATFLVELRLLLV